MYRIHAQYNIHIGRVKDYFHPTYIFLLTTRTHYRKMMPGRRDTMDAIMMEAMLEAERLAKRERITGRLKKTITAMPWLRGEERRAIMRCVEEG